jgi:hypothetical protein
VQSCILVHFSGFVKPAAGGFPFRQVRYQVKAGFILKAGWNIYCGPELCDGAGQPNKSTNRAYIFVFVGSLNSRRYRSRFLTATRTFLAPTSTAMVLATGLRVFMVVNAKSSKVISTSRAIERPTLNSGSQVSSL